MTQSVLQGKHIVLGITGGIAAYKAVTLLRLLKKAGAEVQVVITPNGREFITPVTLSSLSGNPVICDFFNANTGEWHSHVDLGLWADAMVIAPATASTLGKMANGIADNMLVTTYLSSKAPVLAAPAMDLDMWAHPSTQRNIARLQQDGVVMIMPAEGELASHLVGKGRMQEPEEIFRFLEEWLQSRQQAPLKGKRYLVTAGPTYEKLDPVRFIGNYSSGKMGVALADALAEQGASVELVCGPVQVAPAHKGVRLTPVESARQMLEECQRAFPCCDGAVLCAAVADYRPETCEEKKIKREKTGDMTLRLVKNPDIAATLGASKKPGQTLVGFALETDDEQSNAMRKMQAKNLDWIALNSLRDPEAGFCKDTNKVTLFSSDGRELPLKPGLKIQVAREIVNTVFVHQED